MFKRKRYFIIIYYYMLANNSCGHGQMNATTINYPSLLDLNNYLKEDLDKNYNSKVTGLIILNIIELNKKDWISFTKKKE